VTRAGYAAVRCRALRQRNRHVFETGCKQARRLSEVSFSAPSRRGIAAGFRRRGLAIFSNNAFGSRRGFARWLRGSVATRHSFCFTGVSCGDMLRCMSLP